MQRFFDNERAVLWSILAIAAVLRIVHLNAPIWFDEIYTLVTHVRLPWDAMMGEYSMNHHYLFSLQSKLSIAAFGESSWALRLPAMLFGLGSIWAIWAIARRVSGPVVAHLTALMLALSYHHIWFSQNARGYTELLFWGTLGTLLFIRGLRRDEPGDVLRIWLAYAVVMALGIFTHLTGAFFFAAHGVIWLIWIGAGLLRGDEPRVHFWAPALGFILGLVLSVVLYAPLLASIVDTVGGVADTSAIDVMQEYQNPIWTMTESVRTAVGGGPLAAVVGPLVMVLMILGVIALHRKEPLVAPVAIVHIVLSVVILSAVSMRIWPRFFFVDAGILYFMIVEGVMLCVGFAASLLGGRRWLTGLAAAGLVLFSGFLAARNYTAPKQDYAGAHAYVMGEATEGDRVLTIGHGGGPFVDYFEAGWTQIKVAAELEAALAAPGRTWIVIGFPERSWREHADVGAVIDEKMDLAKLFPGTLGDGTMLVFVSR